jgi:hypothetical protein
MSNALEEEALTRADLATPADARRVIDPVPSRAASTIAVGSAGLVGDGESLAALFMPDSAKSFRDQWDAIQTGFVDDPKEAVRKADELVAQVMKSLAETFSSERNKLEAEVDNTEQASTENLRIALRSYRSFFQRLLSL